MSFTVFFGIARFELTDKLYGIRYQQAEGEFSQGQIISINQSTKNQTVSVARDLILENRSLKRAL